MSKQRDLAEDLFYADKDKEERVGGLMNFERVKAHKLDLAGVVFWCMRCNKRLVMGQMPVWADRQGKPFRDYFCNECK